jgi:hypothetical protein
MLVWLRDFGLNVLANIAANTASPIDMIGYAVALAFGLIWLVRWHRKRIAEGKRGMDTWYVISSAGIVTCIAIAIGAYGVGLRSVKQSTFPTWPETYKPEVVNGKTFRNQEVFLDGKSYTNCTFENVTFVYDGTTPLMFNNNHMVEPLQFKTNNPSVFGTMLMIKGFGLMKSDTASNLQVFVNNEPKTLHIDAPARTETNPVQATTPPKITTSPADVPKKLAAIDALRKILNDEMPPWINSGQQLSTGGWWNWYVGDQIPQMQDSARIFFKKSQELDQEIQHLQSENVQFPDIHTLASSPLGTPFLLKIEKLVTPILALPPDDPAKKMGNDLYRFLFEPYAKETYAALNDVQSWRFTTDRNALELRKQLSQ